MQERLETSIKGPKKSVYSVSGEAPTLNFELTLALSSPIASPQAVTITASAVTFDREQLPACQGNRIKRNGITKIPLTSAHLSFKENNTREISLATETPATVIFPLTLTGKKYFNQPIIFLFTIETSRQKKTKLSGQYHFRPERLTSMDIESAKVWLELAIEEKPTEILTQKLAENLALKFNTHYETFSSVVKRKLYPQQLLDIFPFILNLEPAVMPEKISFAQFDRINTWFNGFFVIVQKYSPLWNEGYAAPFGTKHQQTVSLMTSSQVQQFLKTKRDFNKLLVIRFSLSQPETLIASYFTEDNFKEITFIENGREDFWEWVKRNSGIGRSWVKFYPVSMSVSVQSALPCYVRDHPDVAAFDKAPNDYSALFPSSKYPPLNTDTANINALKQLAPECYQPSFWPKSDKKSEELASSLSSCSQYSHDGLQTQAPGIKSSFTNTLPPLTTAVPEYVPVISKPAEKISSDKASHALKILILFFSWKSKMLSPSLLKKAKELTAETVTDALNRFTLWCLQNIGSTQLPAYKESTKEKSLQDARYALDNLIRFFSCNAKIDSLLLLPTASAPAIEISTAEELHDVLNIFTLWCKQEIQALFTDNQATVISYAGRNI